MTDCQSGVTLFLPDVYDLTDIHHVNAKFLLIVPLTLLKRHQFLLELLSVDLLTFNGEVSLLVDRVAELCELRGKAGALHLVLVTS